MAVINILSSDGSVVVAKQSDCSYDLTLPPSAGLSLKTVNSASVLLGGNGGTVPLRADIRLSVAPGNALIQMTDGLYTNIPSHTETIITIVDTVTMDLTAFGQSSHTLRADVKIAQDAGNALIVKPTGLFVQSPGNITPYTDANARQAISSVLPITYNSLTGIIGINQATAASSGYVSAVDWSIFNSKEPSIAAGGTNTYWRGDKTFQLLNTTVVQEGTNLYYTDARTRAALSAAFPLVYTSSTGVFSIPVANASTDGYIASTDWTVFNTKVGNGTNLGSGSALAVFKDKLVNNLEFRGVRAGANILATLQGDDIVLAYAGTVPVVNAGPDLSVVLPTTTATMSGGASTAAGTISSTRWERISGPAQFFITDASALNTSITSLDTGTYTFRLIATNSFGLTSSDDMVIVVSGSIAVLDTVYWGAKAGSSVPTPSEILAGTSDLQNGALDVTADWTALTSGAPLYCFFAIPDLGTAYNKNKWFVDILNNGHIGDPSDLFGPPSSVTVAGNPYLVWITNYATQFIATCQLQKV